MTQGTLSNFIDYFRTWADAHPDVRFFLFGGVEKGIEHARSNPDLEYPMIWLEEPSTYTSDNEAGHLLETYQVGITALQYAPSDDHEAQVAACDQTLRILYNLQKKLRDDNRNNKIVCSLNGMKKEPISQLWFDSHYGYRLELIVSFNLNTFLN